jgi:hypothetical protein
MFWITEAQLNALTKPGLRSKRRLVIASEVKTQVFASETVQINRIALHKGGANIDHAPKGSLEIYNAEPILVRKR